MSSGNEGVRRRAPRLPIRVAGRLGGRVPRDITVLDISLTGFLARCGAALDPGAIFDVTLDVDARPLVAKIRVADCSLDGTTLEGEGAQYLAGLQFLGLTAADQDRLRRFLDAERRRQRSADAPAH
jgi:hypothetical protein